LRGLRPIQGSGILQPNRWYGQPDRLVQFLRKEGLIRRAIVPIARSRRVVGLSFSVDEPRSAGN
jgi:hypothetical protein